MKQKKIKKPIYIRLRNNFFAGAVVLIPLGITLDKAGITTLADILSLHKSQIEAFFGNRSLL